MTVSLATQVSLIRVVNVEVVRQISVRKADQGVRVDCLPRVARLHLCGAIPSSLVEVEAVELVNRTTTTFGH